MTHFIEHTLFLSPIINNQAQATFIIAFFKALRLELALLVIIGLFFWKGFKLKLIVARIRQSKSLKILLLASSLLILLFNSRSLYHIFKYRYMYYNPSNFYKHELYINISNKINEGHYIEAGNAVDKLVDNYPEDQRNLSFIKNLLKEFSTSADITFSLGSFDKRLNVERIKTGKFRITQ